MKAVLHEMAPGIPVIDLFADAPVGNPKAAAYAEWFAAKTVFLGIVDPGVGGSRPAIIVEADGRWFVGPGNGLFELVQRRARSTRSWDIEWKPVYLSASFHGRDLFAPVAAMLARGEPPPGRPHNDGAHRHPDWADDLREIVYHFGNAMTGLRARTLARDAKLRAAGLMLERARTFSDQPPGMAFWYEISNGDRGTECRFNPLRRDCHHDRRPRGKIGQGWIHRDWPGCSHHRTNDDDNSPVRQSGY